MAGKPSERRDGPRIDLRLRVRYAAGTDHGEAEASDVSPKGLRLESEHKVEAGAPIQFSVDLGTDDEQEFAATGRVMWCRPRPSPTGKQMFDIGVSFDSDWLAKDRGPLGAALARIFAMGHYEPARTFERTAVHIAATTAGPQRGLTVTDLSSGGMRFHADDGLGNLVRVDAVCDVAIEVSGTTTTCGGRIAWVTGGGSTVPTQGPRVSEGFGVEFTDTSDAAHDLLERIRSGQVEASKIVVTLR